MANPVARGAGMRQKIVEAEAAARTEHTIEQESDKIK
jgi:hypothetical protein